MSTVIKVDRVNSCHEAVVLEDLGATMIGLELTTAGSERDQRAIDEGTALAIRSKLKRAKLCGTVPLVSSSTHEWFATIQRCGFDYVQVFPAAIPNIDVRRRLTNAGVGIVYGRLAVSHDDDPSWILSQFRDLEDAGTAYYQLELLPEMKNSWRFLKESSPDFPDEIQIEDIDQLASAKPILISIDFDPSNSAEILGRFRHIAGLAFNLGTSSDVGAEFHGLDFAELSQVLKAVSAEA